MPIQLSTTVTPPLLPERIELNSRILSIGSCFSVHMAEELARNRFRMVKNPTGLVFHPLAICRVLERVLARMPFTKNELFFHESKWRSLLHHGSFAMPEADSALKKMNSHLSRAENWLNRGGDWLILTFGTACGWFHHSAPEQPVVNCHRLPEAEFSRRLVPAETLTVEITRTLKKLKVALPALRVLITVSPVRHLRQRPWENSVSKAHLLISADNLARELDFVYTFPAYEIFMDELRDYRFCERDLCHPNDLARDIIWERFQAACIAAPATAFIKDWEAVLRLAGHRSGLNGEDRKIWRQKLADTCAQVLARHDLVRKTAHG